MSALLTVDPIESAAAACILVSGVKYLYSELEWSFAVFAVHSERV